MCNSHEESYYKIKELSVVPCKVIDKPKNRLYVYNKAFDQAKDSIRFTFSVDGISFVDQRGNDMGQDLPYLGNSGIYDSIINVKVFIQNQNFLHYHEVSKDLSFDTSKLLKPIFLLEDDDVRQMDQFYNEKLGHAGHKFYTDFKSLVGMVNSRHSYVSHRMLVRSDLKPYVIFSIPKAYISPGMNEVMVKISLTTDTVTATENFSVNK